MKNQLIGLLLVVLLAACNPTMFIGSKAGAIKKYCTQDSATFTLVDTIRGTVTVPTVQATVTINCDSFRLLYDSLLKMKSTEIDSNGFKEIFNDSNLTIKAKPNKDGSTSYKAITKPKEIPFSKPIIRIVKIPCNCPALVTHWYDGAIKWFAIFGAIVLVVFIYTLSPKNR